MSEKQLESVGDRRWGHVNALGWGHRAPQQVEPTCPFKSVNLVGLETVSGFRQMVRNGHLDHQEPTYCQKVRPAGWPGEPPGKGPGFQWGCWLRTEVRTLSDRETSWWSLKRTYPLTATLKSP